MLDEKVDDQDLDKKLDETEGSEETEDTGDDSWKDKQKVPYRRLEAQSRKAQKLEDDLNDLKGKFENLTKVASPKGVWDDKVKNAQSWDEVFNELPSQFLKALLENPEMKSQFVSAIKTELKGEEAQIEEKIDREIDNLWDKNIITTKDEQNRVIKYAVKESEESGEYVPLAVAVRMMKKEGVWTKKLEDRKDANSKVRPGNASTTDSEKEKSSYSKFRHESIDSIVADAASKFKA